MEKVWHPYTSWECFRFGMWEFTEARSRNLMLKKAIEFTGDAKIYGEWMMRVIVQWPISCEHHLSDSGTNRRAYVGHAAACLAIKCPEDITRKAWGHLSKHQQDEANYMADVAISAWEVLHERRAN